MLKWVILTVNALFLLWLIVGIVNASPSTEAEQVGTAIGAGIIVVFWALADVILGVVWLVTRKR